MIQKVIISVFFIQQASELLKRLCVNVEANWLELHLFCYLFIDWFHTDDDITDSLPSFSTQQAPNSKDLQHIIRLTAILHILVTSLTQVLQHDENELEIPAMIAKETIEIAIDLFYECDQQKSILYEVSAQMLFIYFCYYFA